MAKERALEKLASGERAQRHRTREGEGRAAANGRAAEELAGGLAGAVQSRGRHEQRKHGHCEEAEHRPGDKRPGAGGGGSEGPLKRPHRSKHPQAPEP